MGLQAQTRVKSWMRLLAFVPALLVMVCCEVMLRSTEGFWRTAAPYLFGFFFGIALALYGLSGEVGRGIRRRILANASSSSSPTAETK